MNVRTARWRDRHIIRTLLHRDFPEDERVPTLFLYWMGRRKIIDFLVYLEGDDIIGFTYVIRGAKMAYLFYLDVDERHRGKGYGSEILKRLQAQYQDIPLTLNIECEDPKAANNDQRKRRKAFYLRNGFLSAGYMNKFPGGLFEILTNHATFEPKDFQRIFKQFSWGLFSPKLYPMPNALE